jgi:nucleolar pre-ribosomal-associated protein 1
MQYTPFTSILKVLVEGLDEDSSREIHSLLGAVLVDNHVLQDRPASFSSLVSSLKESGPEHLHDQLAFLDNCICRAAKKPVHYQDQVEALHRSATESVSFLIATIVEQWPFVVKSGNATTENAVGAWIAGLLGRLKQAGENSKALKSARDTLYDAAGDKKTRSLLKKALKVSEETQRDSKEEESKQASPVGPEKSQKVDLDGIFGPLTKEGETHNELRKWEKEELDVAIEQGRIAELMLCLCSEYEEVRRQAYTNISRFMAKLRVS